MKKFFILGILVSITSCYAMDGDNNDNNDNDEKRTSYQQRESKEIQNILAYLRSQLPPCKEVAAFIDEHATVLGILFASGVILSKL